ncbi:MAG: hypothetical protein HZB34_07915 [Nitrospirae bacterium]|nr:hypothetical protein [Nitrospirota bacterium]
MTRVRILAIFWLTTWMLVVPFFHIHPEADHLHGDASHVHGGTIHTVFSPDLECEFTETVHDSTCPESAHQHLQTIGHFGHALNHAELDFSLLTVPIDRPQPKPGIIIAELPSDGSSTTNQAIVVAALQPDTPPNILFLSTAIPLRAPPFQSL